MGDVFRLLLSYLNGFTERLGALKAPQKKKKNAFSATQVSVFWGKWLHRFNQARLNSRDGPSGVSFYRCFHLHFPSPAASACFPSEISPMWQLMCHWDPADSCQQPHLEANGRDGKQQASFPADKNTNMNCYYYYPIFRLWNRPQLFNHLPSWVVNGRAKSLQICLFIYITSRANINAQFPSSGPSHNAFILCK